MSPLESSADADLTPRQDPSPETWPCFHASTLAGDGCMDVLEDRAMAWSPQPNLQVKGAVKSRGPWTRTPSSLHQWKLSYLKIVRTIGTGTSWVPYARPTGYNPTQRSRPAHGLGTLPHRSTSPVTATASPLAL